MAVERHLEIPEHIIYRELEGDLVLLNLNSGQYFCLEGVGGRIWTLLAAGEGLGSIAKILGEEYDVGQSQLQTDLDQLIAELESHGLVSISPLGTGP